MRVRPLASLAFSRSRVRHIDQHTLATIARIEKFRGHLYNWYDTATLRPFDASPFVSSVDSGNLVASLCTLHAGARAPGGQILACAPVVRRIARAHTHPAFRKAPSCRSLTNIHAGPRRRSVFLDRLAASREGGAGRDRGLATRRPAGPWLIQEALHRVDAITHLLENYLPWLLPQFAALRDALQPGLGRHSFGLNCAEALEFAEDCDLT